MKTIILFSVFALTFVGCYPMEISRTTVIAKKDILDTNTARYHIRLSSSNGNYSDWITFRDSVNAFDIGDTLKLVRGKNHCSIH